MSFIVCEKNYPQDGKITKGMKCMKIGLLLFATETKYYSYSYIIFTESLQNVKRKLTRVN